MTPIPTSFTDSGHTYSQVIRKGLYAVYLRVMSGKRSWETIRIIQDLLGGREHYPEHWRFGMDGFCFGCEKLAMKKLKQLSNSR